MRFRLPRRAPDDHTIDELRKVALVRLLLRIRDAEQEAAERAEVVDDDADE